MKTKTIKIHGKDKKMVYPISDQDFENQENEIHVMEHYAKGLEYVKTKKDAVVVDLGANIGNASLYFAPYVKQVYAFEPNPLIFEALGKNTSEIENIKIFNYGVSYDNHTLVLKGNEKEMPPQTLFLDENVINVQPAKFKTIETIFKENNIEHVDVVKCDIEGGEYTLFCSSYFAKVADRIDTIIGEAHYMTDSPTTPEFIPLVLEEFGFKTEFLDFKPPNYLRYLNYKDDSMKETKTWEMAINTIFWAYK